MLLVFILKCGCQDYSKLPKTNSISDQMWNMLANVPSVPTSVRARNTCKGVGPTRRCQRQSWYGSIIFIKYKNPHKSWWRAGADGGRKHNSLTEADKSKIIAESKIQSLIIQEMTGMLEHYETPRTGKERQGVQWLKYTRNERLKWQRWTCG